MHNNHMGNDGFSYIDYDDYCSYVIPIDSLHWVVPKTGKNTTGGTTSRKFPTIIQNSPNVSQYVEFFGKCVIQLLHEMKGMTVYQNILG